MKKRTVTLKGYTLVVTGFPRSGTSMMMRMLEFGGIKVLADSMFKLPQHKHDPYGCLELENVGSEIKNKPIKYTRNKAVKIVSPYWRWYPIDRPMKAIFMQRDINEILTSLFSMRSIWEDDIPETIADSRGYLAHMKIPTLFLQYKQVLNYPRSVAMSIADFLEIKLDIESMAKAIDKNARTRYQREPSMIGHDKADGIIRVDHEAYKDLNIEVYSGGPDEDYTKPAELNT